MLLFENPTAQGEPKPKTAAQVSNALGANLGPNYAVSPTFTLLRRSTFDNIRKFESAQAAADAAVVTIANATTAEEKSEGFFVCGIVFEVKPAAAATVEAYPIILGNRPNEEDPSARPAQ